MELENENPWYCSDDCKPDTTSSPSLSTNTTSTKPQKRRTRAKAPPVPDTIEESIDDTSTAPKFQRDESSPVPQQRRARTKASYVPKTMEDSIDETTKVTLPHRAKLSTTPQHSANVPHVTTIMEDFIKEAGEEFRSHGRKLHYAKTNIETKRGAPLTLDELEFIHGARKSWAKKFEEGRKEFVAKMKEKGYLE
jgi:hypothetical protein